MRFLISTVAISAFVLCSACSGAQTSTTKAAGPAAQTLPKSAQCPVAKKIFKPTEKTDSSVHNGKTYYFCCPGCTKKFKADPAKYAQAPSAKPAAAAATKSQGCSGDCSKGKGCASCANPNAAASKSNGVKMMTAADLGDRMLAKTKCTVTGGDLEPTATTKVATYQGKTYYFCCPGCARKFATNPSKFVSN